MCVCACALKINNIVIIGRQWLAAMQQQYRRLLFVLIPNDPLATRSNTCVQPARFINIAVSEIDIIGPVQLERCLHAAQTFMLAICYVVHPIGSSHPTFALCSTVH